MKTRANFRIGGVEDDAGDLPVERGMSCSGSEWSNTIPPVVYIDNRYHVARHGSVWVVSVRVRATVFCILADCRGSLARSM